MSKTVFEQIWGELIRDGKTVQRVKLDLTVRELYVDERAEPIGRAIVRMSLSATSAREVEDGNYTLRFTFNGKQEEHAMRARGGTLLAGVSAGK